MADQDTSQHGAPVRRGARRKLYLLGLAALFIIAGLAYGAYYFLVAQYYASTDDAYVAGNKIALTSQMSGTVTTINADDTDLVHAGQTLVRLDPSDARDALDHAEAKLAETVRSVHQLFAQVDEQNAIVDQRRTALAQAKRDYERDKRLVDAHGVTRKAFEQARSTYRENQAALSAARHKLSELKARTDGTTLRDHPRVKQAEASLRQAYLQLQRTRIPAPVTGYVAQRQVQVGQRVNPSKTLLTIVPAHQVWVDANFKETELASMRIGQPATVVTDFYGSNVVYHGHVAGISPGTGSAFELLPPQNATGNWIKVVRRVPVRIALENRNHILSRHPLRLGLSTEVSVDLHDTSGPQLAKKPPQTARYQTQVYKRRMAGANKLIHRIVNANAGSAAQHNPGGKTQQPDS